jgi:hypothetical protein
MLDPLSVCQVAQHARRDARARHGGIASMDR